MERRLFLAVMAAAAATPSFADNRRSFRLGVTRWPPEATFSGLARVEGFIQKHCDMAAPMVLGGVPWVAERDGTGYSAALNNELNWKAPKGYPVCLSLGALNTMRDGLAPLYGEKDNLPLPEDMADLAFDDPLIIETYNRFCIKAAKAMQPDWLIIGVEVNLLLHHRPDLWPAYKRMHGAVFDRIKAALPSQKIGFTVAALHYQGLADGTDAALHGAEMLELSAKADLVGWSIYPHASWDVTLPLAADFFDFIDQFAQRSGKPAAITESGMTDRRVWIGVIPLWGSPEAQVQVIETMFAAADKGQWEFVVNWTSHDYPALLELFPAEVYELGQIWVHTGLAHPDGTAKPALEVWDATLARPYGR
jgi:hypothetical protein